MPSGMLLGIGLALLLDEPALPILTWEAPLHCPSQADTTAAIEHYLGRSLLDQDPPTSMHVREAAGGYRLELRTRAGAHVIEGSDCGRLAQLAASVAAIVIDPLADPPTLAPPSLVRHELEPSVPAVAVVGDEAPAPPIPEPALDPPKPEPEPVNSEWQLVEAGRDDGPSPYRRSNELRGLLTASAGLGLNVFPSPAPGFEAGLGLDRGALHVEVGGGGWFAGRFRSSEGDVGGDLSAWQVNARPCGVPRWRRIELRACGLLTAGQVHARGVGVVDPKLLRQPWVSLGAELGLAVVLHRNVALFLDLGAAANLLRPKFWTEAPRSEYMMPLISGRGRFGIEVRFP